MCSEERRKIEAKSCKAAEYSTKPSAQQNKGRAKDALLATEASLKSKERLWAVAAEEFLSDMWWWWGALRTRQVTPVVLARCCDSERADCMTML
jgi:hypothetical protein